MNILKLIVYVNKAQDCDALSEVTKTSENNNENEKKTSTIIETDIIDSTKIFNKAELNFKEKFDEAEELIKNVIISF